MTYTENNIVEPTSKDAELETTESVSASGLSYKFQRLRERIRSAVTTGELQGKLPGERALAKKFNVNAKTLSKALTDLAAEGLLDRSIGRGTYVKGTAPEAPTGTGRWLVFTTPELADSSIVRRLRVSNPELHIHTDDNWDLRPSFLGGFNAAVSLNPAVPDALLRSLVVRGMTVVTVDYQPKVYSMHSVLDDKITSASTLARRLLTDGHRRFLVVEDRAEEGTISSTIRQAALRLAPEATIDRVEPSELSRVVNSIASGVTIVCGSPAIVNIAKSVLPSRSDVSIWAVGSSSGATAVGGCFGDEAHKVDAIVATLAEPPSRPSTIWLAGQFTQGPLTMVTGDAARLPDALTRNVALAS